MRAASAERPAEEAPGRARPRDRGHEGDHGKNGERPGASAGSVATDRESAFDAPALLSVARSTVGYVPTQQPGRARDRGCATPPCTHGSAIARFTSIARRPGSAGTGIRLWQLAAAGAEETAAQACCCLAAAVAGERSNQVWAYDFVFDACANGQPLKCLVVTDEWTHEALQIDVQGSIRSRRVIDVLSARQRTWRASLPAIRQWPGVRQPRDSPLAAGGGIETGYRTGQALAEWHGGKPQRQVPRRVPEHGVVPQPHRGSGHHRNLASALQRGSAAFEPRVPHAQAVQGRTQATRSSINPPSQPQRQSVARNRKGMLAIARPRVDAQGYRRLTMRAVRIVGLIGFRPT